MSSSRRDFLKGLLALPVAAAAVALVPKQTPAYVSEADANSYLMGWDKSAGKGDFSVGQVVTIDDDGYVTVALGDQPIIGIAVGPSTIALEHIRGEIIRVTAVPARFLGS